MKLQISVAALVCFSVSMPVATAQRVWVVASSAGAGVDFTDIQPAVDAATDGDTVLVHPGSYSVYEINGKGLFVHADQPGITLGASAAAGFTVTLANTTATQQIVLRGFDHITADGVVIANCQGPVLIEDCTFHGFNAFNTVNGATVLSSPRVTFADSSLSGNLSFMSGAGHGILANSSTVTLHGCTVRGGGGNGNAGTSGGSGAALTSSALIADGTTISGGAGDPGFSFNGICLSPASAGGNGIDFRTGTSTVYAFASAIQGGTSGGDPGCGPAGVAPRIRGTGTTTEVSGTPVEFDSGAPARAGQTTSLNVIAPAGATGFLLVSPKHNPLFFAGCAGTVDPDLGLSLTLPIGVVPASGQISIPITIVQPLGLQSANLYLQAVMIQGNNCILGETTALLLLASGF